MAFGPGKYDHLCTYVRKQANAKAAIVIIADNSASNGAGFSVQAPLDLLLTLPAVLRDLADQIEKSNQN